MRSSVALFVASVAVVACTGVLGIAVSDQCTCFAPKPCHYVGHCSTLVGSYCSPGTELCVIGGGDTTPPEFMPGFPRVLSPGARDTSVQFEVSLNEAGRYNFVLLPRNSPAPNSLQVSLGQGANNLVPIAFGEVAIAFSNSSYSTYVGALSPTTDYDLWIVARDTTANVQAAPTLIQFTTDIDRYAPEFSSQFPRASNPGSRSFDLQVSFRSEAGTAYYVVLPRSSNMPLSTMVSQNIILGTLASGSMSITSTNMVFTETVQSDLFDPLGEYDVFVVSSDAAGNLGVTPVRVPVTLVRDTAAPIFIQSTPLVSAKTDLQVSVDSKLDEAGTVFALIMPSGSLAPSAASIKSIAQSGSILAPVLGADFVTVASAGAAGTVTLTGLAENTQYDIHLVAEDNYGNIGTVNYLSFRTTGDTTPPSFGNPAMTIVGIRDNAVTAQFDLSEGGVVYGLALPAGSAPPDPEALRLASTFQAPISAAGTVVLNVAGLQPLTQYEIYAVAIDLSGNIQPTVVGRTVTTLSGVAEFVSGYPTLTSVTETSANLVVSMDATGNAYVVVVPNPSTVPSAKEIRDGGLAGSIFEGSVAVPSVNTEVVLHMTGFVIATHYNAYVVNDNTDGVLNLAVIDLNFVSAGDVDAPVFVSATPKVEDIIDTSITIEVALDESAAVYYVILEPFVAAPTRQAVVDRTAGGSITDGSVNVGAGNQATRIEDVGMLIADTDYVLYIIARDPSGNLQASLTTIAFTTSSDATAALFTAPYPMLIDITEASAAVLVQLPEPGSIVTVAVPADILAINMPTATDILIAAEVSTTGGRRLLAAPFVAVGSVKGLAAGVEGRASLSGLQPATNYIVLTVSIDTAGNIGAIDQKLLTTSPDTGPPNAVTNFPQISAITEKGATVLMQIDEPGQFFYVVVPKDHAFPSSAAVQLAVGTNIYAFGSADIVDPAVTGSSTFAGLRADTVYDCYVVAMDGAQNLQNRAASVRFMTLPDATAPTFATGFPALSETQDRSTAVVVEADEEATWHVVILAASSPAPIAFDVRAGLGANGASPISYASGFVDADTQGAVRATGLLPQTNYVAYVVAADYFGNVQVPPAALPFTTAADVYPPIFDHGMPDITGTTVNDISVVASANEPGDVFWVVLPNGATAPTAQMIISATNNDIVSSGSQHLDNASHVAVFDIRTGPLEPETGYDIWFVMRDHEALVNDPVKLDATTREDPDAPITASGYPVLDSTADRSAKLSTQTNEHGRFWVVALVRGSTAPSVADIRNGNGANGAASEASAYRGISADVAATLTIYNLDPSTDYDFWTVCSDFAGNTQAAPVLLQGSTAVDTHAPKFLPGSPAAADITESFLTISAAVSEACDAFYVVVESGDAAPTVTEILAAQSSAGGVPVEAGAEALGVGGVTLFVGIPTDVLVANHGYDIHLALMDKAGIQSVSTSLVQMTTIVDDVAPTFRSSYPSVSSLQPRQASLDVSLSERATVFFVVTAAGPSALPSPDDVVSGAAAGGDLPVLAGSFSVFDADVVTSATLVPLAETHSYDVFVVARDSKGNTMPAPVSRTRFITLADSTSPNATDVFIRDITDSSWAFTCTFDEPGTFFWIAVLDGDTEPTTDEVLNGQAAGGQTPISEGSFFVGRGDAGAPYSKSVLTFTEALTQYDVYWVAQDTAAAPNLGPLTRIDLMTPGDTSPPRYMDGFPVLTGVGATSAGLETELHESATTYYMVMLAPFGLADPATSTPQGIVDCVKPMNATTEPVVCGSGPVPGSRIVTTIIMDGLDPFTEYIAYTVSEDGEGNRQTVPVMLEFETTADSAAGQLGQEGGTLFGGNTSNKFDFTFLIIGVIVLALLVLCCCWLGRRKSKYTHLDTGEKVTPDGDIATWDGPRGDDDDERSEGSWSPVERASHDGRWADRSVDLSDVGGELEDDEFEEGPSKKRSGAPGIAGSGPVLDSIDHDVPFPGLAGNDLNRTPVLGKDDRRAFVNREMMDLDDVLRAAEDVSTHVMNRAPDLVQTSDVEEEDLGITAVSSREIHDLE